LSQKLTASVIKNLKPRNNRYLVTDTKTTGLAVVIGANGSKYFYYRYRPSGSRSIVEEPIGNATLLSLDDARKAVAIKAGEVAKGTDLKAQRLSRRKRDKEPDKRASSERSARGSIPRRSAIYPKRRKNGSFRHFRSEIRGYERSALAMWNGNPNAITKNNTRN
jgi:hypothetical protein